VDILRGVNATNPQREIKLLLVLLDVHKLYKYFNSQRVPYLTDQI